MEETSSAPRPKTLLTVLVDVAGGTEQLLVPFPAELTVADLLAEVKRRVGFCAGSPSQPVEVLRAGGPDGPRLYADDTLEAIVGMTTMFFACSASPLAMSPQACGLASPETARGSPCGSSPGRGGLGSPAAPRVLFPALARVPEAPEQAAEAEPSEGSRRSPEEEPGRSPAPSRSEGQASRDEARLALAEFETRSPEAEKEPSPLRPVEEEEPSATEEESEPAPPARAAVHTEERAESPSFEACDEPSAWYFAPVARLRKAAASHPVAQLPVPSPAARKRSPRAVRRKREAEILHDSEVLKVSDQQVMWVVPNVAEKLGKAAKGARWLSPSFSLFGVDDLGLVLYPAGNAAAKPGYCSVGLRAVHGTHLRYTLSVGRTERFTELRQNVTESWGFVDMCRAADEVDAATDTLRVGVTIIDGIEPSEKVVPVGTHRVEWRLKNMSLKLQHCPHDVALYSEEFKVAGLEGLRLKFYPHGKEGADDGYCSLYVEAPDGTEMRARLSVGNKSMSFDRVERFSADSIWGFLAVCKAEEEIVDGELVIAVDVMETKKVDVKLSKDEEAYLAKLAPDQRQFLLGELTRLDKVMNGAENVPSRFRILMAQLPDSAKAIALSRLEAMVSDPGSAESAKLKRWMDGLLQVPFGVYAQPVVTLGEGQDAVRACVERAQGKLSSAVYGHKEPKEKILQILCQWMANPDSTPLVLGIQGPPGNGKTTLCRKGVAEALERPFQQISLGGAQDASVLDGHSFTYTGSSWGRLLGVLIDAKCMNPVVFFDELDKLSETAKGDEIHGVLTHLTDATQNMKFADKFFDGVPIDFSKALFVFSFNDESKLHPVLKDRLTIIHTAGFKADEQYAIAQDFLLPDLCANAGLARDAVRLESLEACCFAAEQWGAPRPGSGDGGVRGLRQALECCVLQVNKLRLLQDDDPKDEDEEPPLPIRGMVRKEKKAPLRVELPMVLTKDIIRQLMPEGREKRDSFPEAMYV